MAIFSVEIMSLDEAAATGVAFLCRRGAEGAVSGVLTAFARVLVVTDSLVLLGIIGFYFPGTNVPYDLPPLDEFALCVIWPTVGGRACGES